MKPAYSTNWESSQFQLIVSPFPISSFRSFPSSKPSARLLPPAANPGANLSP